MGARPRSRGCGTSAVPSPGRPPGRGLRRSGELATRLALPAGGRSAKPRAGVPVPTHQRPRPSLPSLPPGSTGCPARRAASYSRSSAVPATQPGAAAGEPAARMSFVREEAVASGGPASLRPRVWGSDCGARQPATRGSRTGPAPARPRRSRPRRAPAPRRLPLLPTPALPASPPLPLLASTSPAPAGMVAAASGL